MSGAAVVLGGCGEPCRPGSRTRSLASMIKLGAFVVVLACLLVTGCGRTVAIEGLDGAPGPRGERGAPGVPGPPGEPATLAGSRLVPLHLAADDGARAPSGLWHDIQRDETCSFQDLAGEWRCLPRFRSQGALAAWAGATCSGARASAVTKPGYILETSTGALYQLGGALPEAYEINDGECVPVPGEWHEWIEVAPAAFVGATLE